MRQQLQRAFAQQELEVETLNLDQIIAEKQQQVNALEALDDLLNGIINDILGAIQQDWERRGSPACPGCGELHPW